MGLVQDTGTQRDVIDTFNDLRGAGVCIQRVALPIQKKRLSHMRGSPGNQLVRSFEVVIAVQRLVNVIGVGCFVG